MTPSPARASPEPVSQAESVTNQVPCRSKVLTSSARNEPSERLIGVFSSKIGKCGPEWAGYDGEDQTAHLDIFAHIVNGFRIFDHERVVRARCNHAEQQNENRKQWTHVRAQFSLEF